MKTGGWGGRWVTLERPKPPPVADHRMYWRFLDTPLSPRCEYWLRQIDAGWRPNRRIGSKGYDEAAEWYGVYIAELWIVIQPRLAHLWTNRSVCPTPRP